MKVVFWNLKNIGERKLSNKLNAKVAAANYGNNVLDFMVKLVMGDNVWNGVNLNLDPVDLFVLIELKCGGTAKSAEADQGTGVNTLKAVTAAMNTYAAANVTSRPALANYSYDFVKPMIIGNHETVGVIANMKSLTFQARDVLRNSKKQFFLPRSPFAAQFKQNSNGVALTVAGIHAPPPQSGAIQFKRPISFATQLPSSPVLMNTPGHVFLGGDFNCAPDNTWTTKGVALKPFDNPSPPAPANLTLTGYNTKLPSTTLTSMRKKVDNSQTGSARYLKAFYDNILYIPNNTAPEYVPDLVGTIHAGVGLTALLNNYWVVSDHLPVVLVG